MAYKAKSLRGRNHKGHNAILMCLYELIWLTMSKKVGKTRKVVHFWMDFWRISTAFIFWLEITLRLALRSGARGTERDVTSAKSKVETWGEVRTEMRTIEQTDTISTEWKEAVSCIKSKWCRYGEAVRQKEETSTTKWEEKRGVLQSLKLIAAVKKS